MGLISWVARFFWVFISLSVAQYGNKSHSRILRINRFVSQKQALILVPAPNIWERSVTWTRRIRVCAQTNLLSYLFASKLFFPNVWKISTPLSKGRKLLEASPSFTVYIIQVTVTSSEISIICNYLWNRSKLFTQAATARKYLCSIHQSNLIH